MHPALGITGELHTIGSSLEVSAALHKFKSKLTVVAALSDVISRAQNVTAEQAGRLQLVSESARFVADGLHGLIEEGTVEHQYESNRVNLCSLVERAVSDCSPLFELSRIRADSSALAARITTRALTCSSRRVVRSM